MSEATRVGTFDVWVRMIADNDQALQMVPLTNISNMRVTNAGTKIEIGVAGNVINAILNGEFIGGLILCNTKRFKELKAEMELER